MVTQSRTSIMTKGVCSFCKGEIDKAKMTQHLKHCKQRATVITDSMKDETKQKQRLFHILAEGRYNPQYWMHLEVPVSELLTTLDSFFRFVWVECCGHLSAFRIDGASFADDPEDFSFTLVGTEEQQETDEVVADEAEEEEYEDLKPEELAEEVGKFLDLFLSQGYVTISAELQTALRIPRSRDDLVVFLKARKKSMPTLTYRDALEDREEQRRLYWEEHILKSLLDMVEDRSLGVSLEKVVKVGKKFLYEYDFGSTTELNLRVISEREGGISNEDEPISVLARNIPPVILCKVCGKPATRVVSGYFGVEDNAYCNKCARRSEDAEMMLPIVNSPRVGVCGYAG